MYPTASVIFGHMNSLSVLACGVTGFWARYGDQNLLGTIILKFLVLQLQIDIQWIPTLIVFLD